MVSRRHLWTYTAAANKNNCKGLKNSSCAHHPCKAQKQDHSKNILQTWKVDTHEGTHLGGLKRKMLTKEKITQSFRKEDFIFLLLYKNLFPKLPYSSQSRDNFNKYPKRGTYKNLQLTNVYHHTFYYSQSYTFLAFKGPHMCLHRYLTTNKL